MAHGYLGVEEGSGGAGVFVVGCPHHAVHPKIY